MDFWDRKQLRGKKRERGVLVQNIMTLEIKRGGDMSDKVEGCTQIALVHLIIIKAHKYR